jgi:hypothetical protein
VNRSELQRLARDRLRDARVLLAGRRWSGAYYLTGYAVECGLKAAVIVRLMTRDEFPDRKFSEQCWTHNLIQLVALAGLTAALDAERTVDPDFLNNWDTVKDWSESSRYARRTKAQALALYRAVADNKRGVLRWIRPRW